MSRFTEVVFRHRETGLERVYLMISDIDGETIKHRARDYLRADSRNEGLDERAFVFERFNAPPNGPTAEELAARSGESEALPPTPKSAAPVPVSAKFVSERPASIPEIIPAPVLTMLPGGKKKAPVAW